jgi:hypothetical protein
VRAACCPNYRYRCAIEAPQPNAALSHPITGYTFSLQSVLYYMPNALVTWEMAYIMCQVRRMQLASIWSTDMGAALHAQVKALGPSSDSGYWTGGNDKATEGNWTWADGTAWAAVANWGTGQPDNCYGNQNCMYVRRDSGGDGLWDDVGCDNDLDKFYPLCASACECGGTLVAWDAGCHRLSVKGCVRACTAAACAYVCAMPLSTNLRTLTCRTCAAPSLPDQDVSGRRRGLHPVHSGKSHLAVCQRNVPSAQPGIGHSEHQHAGGCHAGCGPALHPERLS